MNLDFLLRRTRRDVASAEKAVAFVGTLGRVAEKIMPKPYTKLVLTLADGGTLWWTWSNAPPNSGVCNRFLRWYHGRKGDAFTMYFKNEHDSGVDMVRRCDIKRYQIRHWEE